MSRQTFIGDYFLEGAPRREQVSTDPGISDLTINSPFASSSSSSRHGGAGGYSQRRGSGQAAASGSSRNGGRGGGSRGRPGNGRGTWSNRGRGDGQYDGSTRHNTHLADVSTETRNVLPDILRGIPSLDAAYSERVDNRTQAPLSSARCPRFSSTRIQVVNEDTFNAALDLAQACPHGGRVAVLNLASDVRAGGGWIKGARAQEEALCYRSSLYLSLHRSYYPFASHTTVLYTPDVVIIREDMESGHRLLCPPMAPQDLPVVSVVSVAALRNPDIQRLRASQHTVSRGTHAVDRDVFAHEPDRDLTMVKMRVALRVMASRGHRLLVLGALGCGAFGNPKEDVALCWREVLSEPEFRGWWQGVVFAVMDKRNEGNFAVFRNALEDRLV